MKKRYATIFLTLLLLTALALPGCTTGSQSTTSPSATTAAPQDNGGADAGNQPNEIIFALQNKPDTIDPSITTNSFAAPFLVNCFEGLLTFDTLTGEIVPGNAESWDISPDGLVYTFKLRDGLKWSDGSPLTAEDYVYTIQRILTPETGAQFLTFVTDYVYNAQEYYDGTATAEELGVKAPNEKTLEITLKNPALFYLEILNTWTYDPVQKATVEANGDQWTLSPTTYVCNGPFKITEIREELVVLEKNPEYYGADKVKLDKITYRYITDLGTALLAYETDEIQGSRSFPPADTARLKSENAGIVMSSAYATPYYSINTQRPPYDNVLVRKALNLAVDRTALINDVLQISATPAYSPVAPGYLVDGKDFTEGRSNYDLSPTADPEAARAALAEAGYPNGEGFPTLTLSYYTNENEKKAAEAVAEMLKTNLNIEVELFNEDWAIFKQDKLLTGNFDIARTGWSGDFLHPVNFLNILTSDNMSNYAKYSNPEYDDLVSQAKKETDPQKAAVLMRQADDLACSEYPLINLYYRENQLLLKPYIQGAFLNAKDHLYFKTAEIVR